MKVTIENTDAGVRIRTYEGVYDSMDVLIPPTGGHLIPTAAKFIEKRIEQVFRQAEEQGKQRRKRWATS